LGGLHVNRSKNKTQHRKLALKKEMVVYLTDDLLKNVVGGLDATNSYPISKCDTQCLVGV
jgi:hypothetical protein